MKRILFVMLVLVLSIAFVPTAFANKTICDASTASCDMTSTTFGGGIYQPSAKVTVNVAATTGLAYCASTQHSGASTNQTAGRQFYTKSTSPQIMYAQSQSTTGPIACTSESQEGAPTNGWH